MKLSFRYIFAILILLHSAESQLPLGLGGIADPQSNQAVPSPSPASSSSNQQPQSSSSAAPLSSTSNNLPTPSNTPGQQPTQADYHQPTPTPSSPDDSNTPTSRRNRKPATMDNSDTTEDPSPTSVPSPADQPSAGSGGQNANKQTAIIAGSVVGGVVAFALLGGIITCLNRRGGCTKPSRRRHNNDFAAQPEDFSIDMNETSSPYPRRFVPPNSSSGYVNLQDHPQDVPYYHAQTNVAPAPVWTAGAKPDTVEYKPNEA